MTMFTIIHVAISLIGIAAGIPVAAGLISRTSTPLATTIFLWFTLATNVTGFMLFAGFTPAVAVGILSCALLAGAYYAYYGRALVRGWRTLFALTAMAAFYLNCFVLVAQSFQKIPPLVALNGGPAFQGTQGLLLIAFLGLTYLTLRRPRRAML